MTTHLRLVGAGIAVALTGSLAACGSSATSSPSTTTKANNSSSMPASTAAKDFGPGCSAVPASGAGSFSGMATAPVATAASHNPVLSDLVKAVSAAGLVDTLNNAKGITVFAPDNSAFAKVPSSTLDMLLKNKAELDTLLEYHVVPGRLGPMQLPGTHKTLQGNTLTVSGSGTQLTVNGSAQVVCGNVQTANATVYIINSVLNPMASAGKS